MGYGEMRFVGTGKTLVFLSNQVTLPAQLA